MRYEPFDRFDVEFFNHFAEATAEQTDHVRTRIGHHTRDAHQTVVGTDAFATAQQNAHDLVDRIPVGGDPDLDSRFHTKNRWMVAFREADRTSVGAIDRAPFRFRSETKGRTRSSAAPPRIATTLRASLFTCYASDDVQ